MRPRMNHLRSVIVRLAACAALGTLPACASPRIDPRIAAAADAGRFGVAGDALGASLHDNPGDREYLLSRVQLMLAVLAEGQPQAAEETANDVYALLRRQGLNADRTVRSVVFHEGVRIWKGEPFEQALAYSYIGMQKAMLGEWDNARAAAQSSLFLLRDFSRATGKQNPTTLDIARRAAEADRADAGEGDRLLDHGYVAEQTDFALGYLLTAIASKALGREDEASDNLTAAARANPRLEPLVEQMRQRPFNTVLFVDYGRGPAKIASGPDGAVAEFLPRTRSDDRGLTVRVEGGEPCTVPVAQDVNSMARSHRWRNLEEVRALKSTLGDLLLVGGVAVAANSRGDNRDTQMAVGAGMALLGALLKAGSTADTRHAELLPQRTYVVPLWLEPEDEHQIEVQVEGSESRVTLASLRGPAFPDTMQLRYVRIPAQPDRAPWRSGELRYANPRTDERVPGDETPYIFGGRCVRLPDAETVRRYHDAGRLTNLTGVELENLYRAEGITLTVEDQRGAFARHVLDGGTSLVAPLAGTTGYSRLFCGEHPPYKPRSDELRRAIAEERALAGAADRP